MITSLRLINFKNFADETLHLGPFTLIVGANASGKSNIRDAFRFLEGIRGDNSLAEILGGKTGAEKQPVRGAPNEVIRFGQVEFALEVEMELDGLSGLGVEVARYLIRIRREDAKSGQFRVAAESLIAGKKSADSLLPKVLYMSDLPPDSNVAAQTRNSRLRLGVPMAEVSIEVASDRPVLGNLNSRLDEILSVRPDQVKDAAWIKRALSWLDTRLTTMHVSLMFSGMRFLILSPERMREPSLPGATRLGDLGDNLFPVLEDIYNDPKRKGVLLSWLHELTPMDVIDLQFPRDPSGRIHLQIKERDGRELSAYSASDGTLRFLGLLAALLNEDYAGLYFFEEIDNGIHPARLHLLLDLIERQTAKGKIQVVATTHSPDVLNLINDTTFENAVVVYRDEDSADAVIRRVAELPNARELRKSQGLGRLHAGGWMENILSFAEADREEQKSEE